MCKWSTVSAFRGSIQLLIQCMLPDSVFNFAGLQLGGAEGVGLLSHLTSEERRSVLGTAAAQDAEDLEQFAK